MRRLALLLILAVTLTACAAEPTATQYTATFLELFDTVTTVVGYAGSEEEFEATVEPLRAELERYHRLFDIYNDYEGVVNLKTLNDSAAEAPVEVGEEILDLLEDCVAYYDATGGVFNPAMGGVLTLWHEAREDGLDDPANAYLPDSAALESASRHADPHDIIIDRERSTVFFADPELKLDVGAIAKGWAVQRVAESAPSGLLISVGGNVVATGAKDSKGMKWSVGIRNPDGSDKYLHILSVERGAVVTSGSYQRAYVVDGRLYHHIIDPRTLYPSELWTSVTIVCPDSGLADMLSTTLFLIPKEEGEALLARYDAEAMWVDASGNKFYSSGFQNLIRN